MFQTLDLMLYLGTTPLLPTCLWLFQLSFQTNPKRYSTQHLQSFNLTNNDDIHIMCQMLGLALEKQQKEKVSV